MLALIFLTSYSCQEKIDIEKEKAAIIEVLNGEGSAFAANDLEVTGNTAWLICDNIWKYEFNDQPIGWNNVQIAFFEKLDGEWKFSFTAFVPARPAE